VRVHSECLTGDAFGSHRCDCGEQLEESLTLIARHGGIVVYVRGHEGRGIGLWEKIRAYALQEQGADTVDANLHLGHPEDARDYRAAAAILTDMGIDRVRLLTNNPAKISALEALGVEVVDRVPLETTVRPQNAQYLATKRSRMRHLLEQGASPATPASASPAQSTQPSQPGFPSTTLPTTPDSHDRKAS
jgi:3,4-dihydroxy 2-butanone 4-phosphate synthase/GTP cyclohydrolase II